MGERLYFKFIKCRMWDTGEASISQLSNKPEKNSDLELQREVRKFILRVIYAEISIASMRSRQEYPIKEYRQ